MKKKLGLAMAIAGILMMALLIERILVFWYNHDTYTGMQIMKAIPISYISFFIAWFVTLFGRMLYVER